MAKETDYIPIGEYYMVTEGDRVLKCGECKTTKAKLTAIGTYGVYDPEELNGPPRINKAAVCVEFKLGTRQYSRHIPFSLDLVREKFETTQATKSELMTKKLMDLCVKELERDGVHDYDLTDVENVLRLKMPYLLHRAIDYKNVTQTLSPQTYKSF